MSEFATYLSELNFDPKSGRQSAWYAALKSGVEAGGKLLGDADAEHLSLLKHLFWNWVRTEELKAWYGERENESLFQGTSVTSLTLPGEYEDPLELSSIGMLEHAIADKYIELHRRHEPQIRSAILENIDNWMAGGAFYGISIASKVISQALKFSVPSDQVVFEVRGQTVDPHQITAYPEDIRQAYFESCLQRLTCFDGVDLLVRELESALVLADISKPKLNIYRDQLLLAPPRCNEICTLISRHVRDLIREKSNGEIAPRSLAVTIFDTDTPYTYHQINGYFGQQDAPVLPGVTILGSSGSVDAFRWLYGYRASLVAQKMMKSSLYSEVARNFIPFVFFGVLVERDAEILLDLDNLDLLRYRGQISPYLEFRYLIPKLQNYLAATSDRNLEKEIEDLLK